MGTGNITEK